MLPLNTRENLGAQCLFKEEHGGSRHEISRMPVESLGVIVSIREYCVSRKRVDFALYYKINNSLHAAAY